MAWRDVPRALLKPSQRSCSRIALSSPLLVLLCAVVPGYILPPCLGTRAASGRSERGGSGGGEPPNQLESSRGGAVSAARWTKGGHGSASVCVVLVGEGVDGSCGCASVWLWEMMACGGM